MGIQCAEKHRWNQNRPENKILPRSAYIHDIFPPHYGLRFAPIDSPGRVDYLADLKNNCKQLYDLSQV